LNKKTEEIKEFLNSSINRFQEENEKPNAVGIYRCPWSSWITTNFNIHEKMEDTGNNCLDFVEFDFMEIAEWENEYKAGNPEFKLKGSLKTHDHELGDEHLNEFVFEYL